MPWVFISETNLEATPSVDNFDHSRLCVVDNCANANIWNTKEDFEVDYLPFSEMFKLCDDDVQSKRSLKFKDQALIYPSIMLFQKWKKNLGHLLKGIVILGSC